jgi:hypothetical protein
MADAIFLAGRTGDFHVNPSTKYRRYRVENEPDENVHCTTPMLLMHLHIAAESSDADNALPFRSNVIAIGTKQTWRLERALDYRRSQRCSLSLSLSIRNNTIDFDKASDFARPAAIRTHPGDLILVGSRTGACCWTVVVFTTSCFSSLLLCTAGSVLCTGLRFVPQHGSRVARQNSALSDLSSSCGSGRFAWYVRQCPTGRFGHSSCD